MSETTVRINQLVSTNIFEVPEIKMRVDFLFYEMKDEIRERFNEILAFVTKREYDKKKYGEISYEEVLEYFKVYFYKFTLNTAVSITFSKEGKYNMLENVLEELSKEKLKEAILGKPMIHAFEKAITKLPIDGGLDACLQGGMKLLIEREFLGEAIPYASIE